MTRRKYRPVRSIVTLLVAAAVAQAAAAFSVDPMTVELSPTGAGAVVSFRVINDTDTPVAVVVSVLTRAMAEDGTELNEPAGELFAVLPSRIVVDPKSVRVVKVQWRGDISLPFERAFRVVVEQVPVDFSSGQASGIRIMFRYLASLYIVPPDARANVLVTAVEPGLRDDAPGLWLTLRNEGDKHAVLRSPELIVNDGAIELALPAEALAGLEGRNMLARSTLTIFIPWAGAAVEKSYEGVLTARYD